MQLIIFTGEKQVGKTTFMQELIKEEGVNGILSPVLDGKRYFVSKHQKHYCMESANNEQVFEVGRFRFRKKAFADATDHLLDFWQNNSYHTIILDELGPLELQNKGFWSCLMRILKMPISKTLIIVVRKSILNEVIEKFQFQKAHIIPFSHKDDLTKLIEH